MIEAQWCGTLSYAEGLNAQALAISKISILARGTILGLEHSAVVTLGKRGIAKDDLNVSEEELSNRGVELFRSERGGQATLHSPGQLVIYPCVSLRALNVGVREYVETLQLTTRDFLKDHGVDAFLADDEPGVYTKTGKIAAFGVKVSKGIASHGVAINVKNDLSLFGLIRSCGKPLESFDCLANYGVTQDPSELFQAWASRFLARFA